VLDFYPDHLIVLCINQDPLQAFSPLRLSTSLKLKLGKFNPYDKLPLIYYFLRQQYIYYLIETSLHNMALMSSGGFINITRSERNAGERAICGGEEWQQT